jgi:hypothetical protein
VFFHFGGSGSTRLKRPASTGVHLSGLTPSETQAPMSPCRYYVVSAVRSMSTTDSNLSRAMTSSAESAGQGHADPNESTTSSASAEPARLSATAHTSVPVEADNDVDEVEALLRRAIEMVRSPKGTPRPLGDAATVPPASGSAMHVVSNGIIQTSHHPRQKAAHTAPDREAGPTDLSDSGVKRAPTSRMVQIQYDPDKTVYVARNSDSGLIVMRHQNSEHLRDVCEWIGWRVADRGTSSSS